MPLGRLLITLGIALAAADPTQKLATLSLTLHFNPGRLLSAANRNTRS